MLKNGALRMHIVQVASELAPIAKVGGLGDVLYGLSKQLVREGHLVEVILPKYDCIHYEGLTNLAVEQKDLCVQENSRSIHNLVWSAYLEDLKILLIEPDHPKSYFESGSIYGAPDDAERFIYFCSTVLEYLSQAKKQPDIIHIHDWPTALIAPLYKERYRKDLHVRKIVFTIHNLQHQGKCLLSHLSHLKLNKEVLVDPDSPLLANLVKGAIIEADAITTVSPNYKQEILVPEGGFGLDPLLLKYQKKLTGILNGIDPVFWNPQTDPHLIAHYSTDPPFTDGHIEQISNAKKENRRRLRRHVGMNEEDCPLVASVTRLVYQKGPELIEHALLRTLEKGGQFILLGSAANPEIEESFLELKDRLKENRQVAIYLDHDEALAHLIFAAADLFVIPSIFEPCGLTQMIALRYGSIPIARRTGGLADTVCDIDTSSAPVEMRNGFTFDFPDTEGVNWALDRALRCYKEEPKKFEQLMRQGMSLDFSWRKSAQEYLKVYR
jgi:starch synthase